MWHVSLRRLASYDIEIGIYGNYNCFIFCVLIKELVSCIYRVLISETLDAFQVALFKFIDTSLCHQELGKRQFSGNKLIWRGFCGCWSSVVGWSIHDQLVQVHRIYFCFFEIFGKHFSLDWRNLLNDIHVKKRHSQFAWFVSKKLIKYTLRKIFFWIFVLKKYQSFDWGNWAHRDKNSSCYKFMGAFVTHTWTVTHNQVDIN